LEPFGISTLVGTNRAEMSRKPRVLRIINRFNLGGPTLNVGYLSKYLSDEYETLLVGGEKDPTEDSSKFIVEKLGLAPVSVPTMKRAIHPLNDYKAYKTLQGIIREFKPDIVHTHASKAGFLGRWAAISEKVPITVHTFHGHVFHGYFNPVKTALFKQLERSLAKRTDAIVVLSPKQQQELVEEHRIIPKEKAEIIPLGFDLQRFVTQRESKRSVFRNTWGLTDNDIAIGIIGRLVPIKNHALFLRSFAQVKAQNPQCKALLIGDGESKPTLLSLCEELGLKVKTNAEDKAPFDVVFTSWIRDVDHAYPGLDIVALSSLNEGTPVSLIEAQAAGVPIVSTNVGGIQDITIPGKSALLSESYEEASFSKALKTMANSAELRLEMASSGREFVLEKFSYQRLCDDMEKLYDRLLSR